LVIIIYYLHTKEHERIMPGTSVRTIKDIKMPVKSDGKTDNRYKMPQVVNNDGKRDMRTKLMSKR